MSPFRASAPLTRDWEHFRLELEDGLATLTFQRPERLNALTFEVYADLRDLLTELPDREEVKVLVITGTGRGFCSGGDVEAIIGRLVEMDERGRLEFTRMTGTVTRRMRQAPQPIIAAVNGVAAGAGAVIALAADLRLAARSASFAFLFTRVGLSGGDMGSAYLLPRLVGFGRAAELLLLGDRVSAEEAQRMGLVTRVVEDEDLPRVARELARRLADGPTLAFAQTKALLTRQLDMDLGSALELDAMTQALLMGTKDHAEFLAAFREKREPRWGGR